MNKRANLYLDIYEFIAFILALSCIGLCMILGELTFPIPSILRYSILIIGLVSTIIFLSIETFLFLLMNTKAKISYIGLLLIDIIIASLINRIYPFSAFFIFILFSLIKDILRIKLVDKLYIPREFNRYCRMFNIKIKDFPKTKKKTVKVTTKTQTVKKEVTVYAPKTKKSTKSDKSFA